MITIIDVVIVLAQIMIIDDVILQMSERSFAVVTDQLWCW